ncbi:MAG: uncharacterized protein K0S45_533 [Nitrospira sp.]|jgi:hypothetical protein|nr:uncharacterized protein [Nitrospira sp.]
MTIPAAISNEEVQSAWVNLTNEVRTAVLLTLRNGHPFGSHVPYLIGDDLIACVSASEPPGASHAAPAE